MKNILEEYFLGIMCVIAWLALVVLDLCTGKYEVAWLEFILAILSAIQVADRYRYDKLFDKFCKATDALHKFYVKAQSARKDGKHVWHNLPDDMPPIGAKQILVKYKNDYTHDVLDIITEVNTKWMLRKCDKWCYING